MGLNLLRWWHLRKATGNVLEIGCGTGRNFDYYNDDKVKKIIAVDAVPGMLLQAMKKTKASKNVVFDVMNAQDIKFPDQSFDTVVDTFGLCSYDDPVAVLKEMSRVCKSSGKILLIEHGRGSYDWINRIIDR
jgi:methyltransferase OMS1, mitochondrial